MKARNFVIIPPLLTLTSGVVLAVASVVAWGAGSNAGIPAWLTTLGGLMFALPVIVASYACLKVVRGLARESFFFSRLQLSVAMLLFAILIAWELALAVSVSNPRSYEGLILEGGSTLSTPELLVVILLFTALKGFVAAAAAYLYAGAVTAEYYREDRTHEEDGIAMLIRERNEGAVPAVTDPRALFARPPHDRR